MKKSGEISTSFISRVKRIVSIAFEMSMPIPLGLNWRSILAANIHVRVGTSPVDLFLDNPWWFLLIRSSLSSIGWIVNETSLRHSDSSDWSVSLWFLPDLKIVTMCPSVSILFFVLISFLSICLSHCPFFWFLRWYHRGLLLLFFNLHLTFSTA